VGEGKGRGWGEKVQQLTAGGEELGWLLVRHGKTSKVPNHKTQDCAVPNAMVETFGHFLRVNVFLCFVGHGGTALRILHLSTGWQWSP
jgi:hypothetical protein